MKKVAFIFPGQGSQTVKMGEDFFNNSQIAKDMFLEASKAIDTDMAKLLFEDGEKLALSEYTQPAILLVSNIAVRLLQDRLDIKPEFMLGIRLVRLALFVLVGH